MTQLSNRDVQEERLHDVLSRKTERIALLERLLSELRALHLCGLAAKGEPCGYAAGSLLYEIAGALGSDYDAASVVAPFLNHQSEPPHPGACPGR